MNDSARRGQLEQELEKVDREYKAALRDLKAAADGREKVFVREEPRLKPFETPEASDHDAMVAARDRFKRLDAEVKRLRAEYQRLRQELDCYR